MPSLCTFWSPSLYWCSPEERLRVCHNQKEATRLDQPADMLSVSYVSEDDPWAHTYHWLSRKTLEGEFQYLHSSMLGTPPTSSSRLICAFQKPDLKCPEPFSTSCQLSRTCVFIICEWQSKQCPSLFRYEKTVYNMHGPMGRDSIVRLSITSNSSSVQL